MSDHHLIGPSGNAWWSKCLAAPRFIEREGLQAPQSEFAAEGDRLHSIAAECLEHGIEPRTRDDLDKKTARLMQIGYDWIMEQGFDETGVELRVDCGKVYPGRFGTLDFRGRKGRRLVIWDWKWGAGIPVTPEENLQLIDYAGSQDLSEINEVWLVIFQGLLVPEVQIWETTPAYIEEQLAWLAQQARIAMEDPDAPFVPGPEQCQLCDAAHDDRCPDRSAYLQERVALLDKELTPEQRVDLWRNTSMIRKWLDQNRQRLIDDCTAGKGPAGVKAVYGDRGNREWIDEAKAEAALSRWIGKKNATTVKLKSPTQVEEEIPPSRVAAFEKLITRKPAASTLVDAKDKRAAIVPLLDLLEDLE